MTNQELVRYVKAVTGKFFVSVDPHKSSTDPLTFYIGCFGEKVRVSISRYDNIIKIYGQLMGIIINVYRLTPDYRKPPTFEPTFDDICRKYEQFNEQQSKPTEIPIPGTIEVDTLIDEMIHTGFKNLARKYHPDIEGEHESMVKLNEARKQLVELLKEIRNI